LAGGAEIGVIDVKDAVGLALGVVAVDGAVLVWTEVAGADDQGVVGPGDGVVIDRVVVRGSHLGIKSE
jgi:hypothetical protein